MKQDALEQINESVFRPSARGIERAWLVRNHSLIHNNITDVTVKVRWAVVNAGCDNMVVDVLEQLATEIIKR